MPTAELYCYASVGRAGLGNMLLPWARCEVFRHLSDASMLAPQWVQPKIGPILRGEKDKRYYVGLFDNSSYVGGLRKWAALWTSQRVPEADASPAMKPARKSVVVFRGMDGMFEPILAHRSLVRGRLNAILSASTRRCIAKRDANFVIGVHVRRGDMNVIPFRQPMTGGHQVMHEQWFINVIQNVRKALGWDAPARIFSDAKEGQIDAIMALPNVTRAADNPSIVDIMMLAKSRVLITTAPSTFSMWASYLGEMPTVWYPGGKCQLTPEKPSYATETDLEGNFGDEFASVLRSLAIRPK